MVEQRPFKPLAVGSIPTAPTNQLVDIQWVPFGVGHIWPSRSLARGCRRKMLGFWWRVT